MVPVPPTYLKYHRRRRATENMVTIKAAPCHLISFKYYGIWERSGSVVECLSRDPGVSVFEPQRRHCVVSMSKRKTYYSLLSTGSTQE